ncbi:DsbA family protein [Altererythrobacter arenosus]|uniref:DsbA family protein n=1 Tax=Altererythrobacter arenosus TaxID=3032592 RepID=A0ABY8FU95_9SPHN|nr:DsbA family protein [Altererythrobacter sp. CAU 1644]WFL78583.1 DsbA family protein [Altererythrobacter sp. CAU 1644]
MMVVNVRSMLLTAVLALVFGFVGAGIWSWSGLADQRTRSYLLEHPELLPQMADAYQRQDAQARLEGIGDAVRKPFVGAVLGNPNGSKVLVEFTDYNCPYCKSSQADVARLIEQDPDLKIVIREWPIFQGSELSTRMALAAAMQGKYAAFHDAMFRLAPATPESIIQAANEAGLDLERAKTDGQSPEVDAEMARNHSLAQQLGFTGTPSWVTQDQAFEGAVGFGALKKAIDSAAD